MQMKYKAEKRWELKTEQRRTKEDKEEGRSGSTARLVAQEAPGMGVEVEVGADVDVDVDRDMDVDFNVDVDGDVEV